MKLSILIPTIPSRAEKFKVLKSELNRQITNMLTAHTNLAYVEILHDDSPPFLEGGPTVGDKRQELVNRATGDYLCFIDDDETIAPNYVESVVRMCLQGADICTFRAFVKMKEFWALVDMRLAYKVNDEISPDFTVRRPPWHMCPVRSAFAKIPKFKSINNAEDFDWMQRVLGMCTTEVHTDKILYSYNHGDHSEVDKIPL